MNNLEVCQSLSFIASLPTISFQGGIAYPDASNVIDESLGSCCSLVVEEFAKAVAKLQVERVNQGKYMESHENTTRRYAICICKCTVLYISDIVYMYIT